MSLRIRRGTDLERSTQLFDQGEIVYTTDTQRLYIGDGSTLGGVSVTGYTTAEAQDAAATIFTDGSHTGISFDYDDITKTMNATVTGGGGVTYGISSETTTDGVNLRLSGSDASADNVKFAEGSNITLTRTDASTITIASTASGSALTVKDEGSNLTTNATSINFAGAGVTATTVGDAVTVTIGAGGGAAVLDDLTDVVITGTPTDGQVLKYNTGTSKWVNGTGGGGATTLDELTDVDVTGAVTGSILKLNGSGVWVDSTSDLIDDTAPTLGGNLDLNGYTLNGSGLIALTTEALTNNTISIITANSTNTSSIIELSRANNTLALPDQVLNNDNLGGINFSGYDTVGYTLSSYVASSVQGTVTPGIVPSRLLFGTTNAAGNLATRVTIDTNGTVNALYGVTLISTGDSTLGSSLLKTRRSRGTTSARTAVQIGDNLSEYLTTGHDGTDYFTGSSITSTVSNTVSTGIVPTSIKFATTDVTGNLNDVIILSDDGSLKAFGGINLVSTGDSIDGSSLLKIRRSRGTVSSPTAIQIGDQLSQYLSLGYDGTDYFLGSSITTSVTGAISTGIVPTSMTFATTDVAGNLNDVISVSSDGSLKSFGTVEMYNAGNSQGGTTSLSLLRSRGTVESPTTVINNDVLYQLTARAYEGTSYVQSSAIRFQQEPGSTIATNKVPGRLTFLTADTNGVLQSAVYIDSTQRLFTLNGLSVITDDATKTNANIVELRNYHDSGTDSNNLAFIRSRGTITVPVAVQAGDYIYDINYMGYDGTNVTSAASIRARVPVGSTVSAGIVPGSLSLGTRNQAGTFAPRLTIDSTAATFAVVPTLPTFASETAANTAVGTPVNGMMYYDSGAGKIKGYQGGAWVILQP
jgi:hypothetical protein